MSEQESSDEGRKGDFLTKTEIDHLPTLFQNLHNYMTVCAFVQITKAIYPSKVDQISFLESLIENWSRVTKAARINQAMSNDEPDVQRILGDIVCESDIDFQKAVDRVSTLVETSMKNMFSKGE